MKIVLRVLKAVLFLLAIAAFVGFIYHFIKGIDGSIHGNDEITAQDRIGGAYQFLRMVLAGLVTVALVFPTLLIKVPLLPESWNEKIKGFFGKIFHKKNNEEEPKPEQ